VRQLWVGLLKTRTFKMLDDAQHLTFGIVKVEVFMRLD
jgi:hypothetical protein